MVANQSLRDLLRVIFKHKWKLLLTFLTVTCLAVFIIIRQAPVYESTAKILVKEGRENYTPATAVVDVPEGIVDITRQEDINSEIEILRSRLLAEKVVGKLGVDLTKTSGQTDQDTGSSAVSQSLRKISHEFKNLFHNLLPFIPSYPPLSPFESAVLRLQKNLDVELMEKSNVIKVCFSDQSPAVSVDVINTLLDFYLDQHLVVHKTPGAYQFFSAQAIDFKQKLEGSEQKLKKFKKRCSLAELGLQREILLKQEGNYESSLDITESEIDEIGGRLLKQKEQLASQEEKIWISEISRRNPLKDQLSSQLSQLKFKEKQLMNTFADANQRKILDTRREIHEVESQLTKSTNPVQSEVQTGLNDIYLELTDSILKNQAELQALEAKKQNLKKSLLACRNKLAALNESEAELNQLQRQIKIDEENYQLYSKKLEENRISEAMDMARFANISILEPAMPPMGPKSAQKILKIFIAILLGLTTGLGVAFLSEMLDNSAETPEELESLLDLPVLGSIPDIKE